MDDLGDDPPDLGGTGRRSFWTGTRDLMVNQEDKTVIYHQEK